MARQRRKSMIRIAGLGLALIVAGCSGGPPWVVGATPDRVALRWYPPDVSRSAADLLAERHCAASGKRAEFASTEQSGSAQIAEFRCR
jgi:hypothetical protein